MRRHAAIRMHAGLTGGPVRSDNTFGVKGAEVLAASLRNLPHMRQLILRDLGIEDEGTIVRPLRRHLTTAPLAPPS
jgi:hypothetical protein